MVPGMACPIYHTVPIKDSYLANEDGKPNDDLGFTASYTVQSYPMHHIIQFQHNVL